MKVIISAFFFIVFPLMLWSQSYDQLVQKAETLFGQKQYLLAARVYEKAFEQEDAKAQDLYKSAGAWSMAKQTTKAFDLLMKAVQTGEISMSDINGNKAFNNLRSTTEWPVFSSQMEQVIAQNLPGTEGETTEDILATITQIEERDQKYRKEKAVKIMDISQQAALDSINSLVIDSLLEVNGYPGIEKVGEEKASVVALALQHLDVTLLKKHFSKLEEAYKEGDLPGFAFAAVVDAMKIKQGQHQVYGTQFFRNEDSNALEFHPIENREGLNDKREEMGLGTIEAFAKEMGILWKE
ncbi:MAG: DUF6624 domain-containing protein [Bacteroidota bacterium]